MVVVANRLPFDMEKLPDGTTRARQAPGGLVTALAPILSRREGAWIGWPGSAGRHPRADHDRRVEPAPGDPVQRGRRPLLRGFLQRDTLAALPRRRRRIAVPSGLVGVLPDGERHDSPRRPPTWPRRARPSGCTTTNCSWCRNCCAGSGRTCGSASSCTSRSRRSNSSCGCRGAPRSSTACWAPT